MKNLKTKSLSLLAFLATTGGALNSSPAHAADNASFRCFGTEPFWSLAIDPETKAFALSSAGSPDAPTLIRASRPKHALGTSEDYLRVYQSGLVRRSPGEPARYATIVIQNAGETGCSDGMSDEVYGYGITYIQGETVLVGCCNKS